MSYLGTSPFGALNQLNRELNRIFTDQPLQTATPEAGRWTPHVDIFETGEAFQVAVDTPGMKPEDIELSLHHGVLTIRGERKTLTGTDGGTVTRRERSSGRFFRQFNLPESADEETVSARVENGVLEIHIPKAKPAQPISIQVTGE